MAKKWDDDSFSPEDVFQKKEVFIGGRRYVLDETRPDTSRAPEPEAMHWLTSPPRRISPGAVMRLVMGGGLVFFGWIFACFGMMFVCIFIGSMHRADMSKDWRDAGNATLVSSEKTNMSVGGGEHSSGSPVYRHVFEKSNGDGESFGGTCHSLQNMEKSVRQPINVEYCEKYGVYRIKGTTVGMLGGNWSDMMVYFVFLFPTVGMGFILYALVSGLRTAWLLRNGEAAKGAVRDIEDTGVRINNRPQMKITYEYTANDGESHTASYRTTEVKAVTDDRYEVLFYDPRKPARIYLLDALPKSVALEEGDGSFRLAGVGAELSTFVMAAFYLLFLGIFIFEWGIFLGGWTL